MNSKQQAAIEEDLAKCGKSVYRVYPGNDCVWVVVGSINFYYVFNSDDSIRYVRVD